EYNLSLVEEHGAGALRPHPDGVAWKSSPTIRPQPQPRRPYPTRPPKHHPMRPALLVGEDVERPVCPTARRGIPPARSKGRRAGWGAGGGGGRRRAPGEG